MRDAELGAVAEQPLERVLLVRGGDHQDLANAREDQRRRAGSRSSACRRPAPAACWCARVIGCSRVPEPPARMIPRMPRYVSPRRVRCRARVGSPPMCGDCSSPAAPASSARTSSGIVLAQHRPLASPCSTRSPTPATAASLDGLPADRFTLVVGDVCDAELVDALVADARRRRALRGRVAQRQLAARPVAVRPDQPGRHLHAAARPSARTSTRYHHISTDEVYGDLELDDPARFTETTPVQPVQPVLVDQGRLRPAGARLGALASACRPRSATAPTTTAPTSTSRSSSRGRSPT